jgi:tetratricopeptide (TPR) repeat protein
MFAKAVDLDPRYAAAYAGMADCDAWLYLTYQVDLSVDSILQLADKALELDANLPEPHASRGAALTAAQKFDEAYQEFERALELDPNSFSTHFLYARSSILRGDLERAANLMERAAAILPDITSRRACSSNCIDPSANWRRVNNRPEKQFRWPSASSCCIPETAAGALRCRCLD